MGSESTEQGTRAPLLSRPPVTAAPEALLLTALEAAPTAMLLVDGDGSIVMANAYAAELFGYDPRELLHQPVEVLVPTTQRDRHAAQRAEFSHTPHVRHMGAVRDLCGLHKSGKEIPIDIGLAPIQGASGSFVVAVINDLTARHAARRAQQLFLAATSHDVRNSLTMISGYARILGDLVNDEESRQVADRIGSLVSNVATIMTDLVTYATLDTQPTEQTTISLRQFLEECARNGAALCQDKGLDFNLRLPEEEPIRTDPKLLRRIIENLLSNAVHYTTRGSVSLAAEVRSGVLHLTITDTGIGIAPDATERIFDAYYRHDKARAMAPLGTGLGLASVRRMLDKLDGDVRVTSKPEQGSTFVVSLPLGNKA